MAAPQAQGAPAAPDQDPRGLHDIAVDVQTDLQKLATGLAHAGANPQAVAQITHMAEIISEVVKVLANGPELEPKTPSQVGGPPPAGGPPAPGPAAPGGPPAPGPAAPGGPPAPGAAPNPAHATLHAATHALHAAMIASKQAAQQQPK